MALDANATHFDVFGHQSGECHLLLTNVIEYNDFRRSVATILKTTVCVRSYRAHLLSVLAPIAQCMRQSVAKPATIFDVTSVILSMRKGGDKTRSKGVKLRMTYSRMLATLVVGIIQYFSTCCEVQQYMCC